MSVALIACYLAFFPIAVGALRGLQVAATASTSSSCARYAAGWWPTLLQAAAARRACRTCCPRCASAPRTRWSAPSSPRSRPGCSGGIGRLIIQSAGQRVERPGEAVGADLRRRSCSASSPPAPSRCSARSSATTADRRPPHDRRTAADRADDADADATDAVVVPRRRQDLRRRAAGDGARRSTGIDLTVARGRVRLAHRPVADAASRRCCASSPTSTTPTAGDDPRSSARPPSRRASTRTTASRSSRPGLLPWRTVAANIALPLELHGVGSRRAPRARRPSCSTLVGLDRVRRPLPRPALRRHAAARRDRPVARRAAAAAAHGRAVRRARRDDARAHADRARCASAPRPAPRSCSSPTRSPRRCSSPTGWS